MATVLTSIVLAACSKPTASEEDEKKAAINAVLAHELACQNYDFDKMDSLHTPDARGDRASLVVDVLSDHLPVLPMAEFSKLSELI